MAAENRPPRRFNIIEARIGSKHYNSKTRKINRTYLKRYTRKRNAVVASLSKLVGARQARAKALLEALNAARFTQMDVGGDGNCFYRALYRVAKEHKDRSVLGKVFRILGADVSRAKYEKSGATALRDATAALVAAQVHEPEGIYERLRDAAALPKSEQLFFKALVDEASHRVAPIYRRIRTYTLKKDGKRNFYRNLSAAVARNGEYASEADYYMVREKLDAGGILMISTHTMPTSSVKDGKPVLYLRRVNENHYNYWREN